jgi:hypothetical protein
LICRSNSVCRYQPPLVKNGENGNCVHVGSLCDVGAKTDIPKESAMFALFDRCPDGLFIVFIEKERQ